MSRTNSVVLDVTRLIKLNFIGGVQQVIWDAIETGEICEYVAFDELNGRWQTVKESKIRNLHQQISRRRSRLRLQFGLAFYALNRKIPILIPTIEWVFKAKANGDLKNNHAKPKSGSCELHGIECPRHIDFLILDIPLELKEINAIRNFEHIAQCHAHISKSAYVHDLMPISAPKMVDDNQKQKLETQFTNYLELISNFKNIRSNSKYTKQELITFGKFNFKEVKVVYPTIPKTFKVRQEEAKLASASRAPIVFVIGPWTERKRFYLIFEALSKLSDQGILFELRVRRNHSASVCHRTKVAFDTLQRKCPDRIKTLNFLTPSDLENEYFIAKVVAIPSAYEGFGLPVLQAASAGAYVACSRNSALEEAGTIVGASFIDDDKPNSWADVISTLLKREEIHYWKNPDGDESFVSQIIET